MEITSSRVLASTGSWSMDSNDVLRDYAYYYEYDGRGRCIKKKLPGAEHILYEYDSRNRMIFSQDGVQRTSGQWTYYLYDGLDRLTEKGVCPNKSLTSKTAHIVNHYDGYSFVGTTGFSNTYYPSGDNNGIGNLTGSVITVFGSDLKIYRAHYYDAKGNVIKTVESNLMGGYDTTTTTYTFTDKPLTVTHAVTNGAINVYLTEVYTYTYDSLDRMVKVQHTLDDTTVTLAEYTYDNVGRMATKQLHGNSTTQLSYTYNVRGWLESIAGNKFNQHLYYTTGNETACYNGNISSMTWEAGDESTLRGYKYTYDAMNRLTAGNYGEGSTLTSNTGRYTESVGQYDKNGNISAGFVRNGLLSTGSYGAMNALVMTLDGNHLQAVRDVSGSTAASGAFEFVDGVTQTTEYTYDNNGNLTQDLNKGITNISYNVLSLPSEVTFSDGSTVTYCYDAEGRKQKVTYNITGETAFHRTYSNGLLYENNVPKQLLTTEGYIDLTDSNSYYYYLKDHQGNNRVVVSSSGTVMETNHYYPFGGVFSTSNVQPYKYNGKELDIKNGLNWYDYGARHYDAALGRFMTQDRFAEKYSSLSSYQYGANSPVCNVDVNGDSIWFSHQYINGKLSRLTMNVTGKVYNDTNVNIDVNSVANNIKSGLKRAFEGKVDNVVFDTNIQLTAVNNLEDILESDHLFVLSDKIIQPKEGTILGASNYLGGKVAFIDSDLFTGIYDKMLGSRNYGTFTATHEFGHLLGLNHTRNKPFNIMRSGGRFYSISASQLQQVYSNWHKGILNYGSNCFVTPYGKKRPNVGIMKYISPY